MDSTTSTPFTHAFVELRPSLLRRQLRRRLPPTFSHASLARARNYWPLTSSPMYRGTCKVTDRLSKKQRVCTMDTTDDQRSLPVIVTAHSPAGSPTVSRLGSPPRLLATDRPQYTTYLSALSAVRFPFAMFFVSLSLSFDTQHTALLVDWCKRPSLFGFLGLFIDTL